jgi:hypothetical protein
MEWQSVYPVGLGTIWAGRVWPPRNARYRRPSDAQIDQQMRTALALLPALPGNDDAPAPAGSTPQGARLMVDTAAGYGDSERRIGEWLRSHEAEAARCVVATKFGELFNAESGETTIGLSAVDAERALSASTEALGRAPDLFYSHVTSQLTPEQAVEVLCDGELTAFLCRAKDEGLLGSLGTSCSFPAVVREALGRGWLEHLDVIQLAAKACVADPALVRELVEAGFQVVVNSPLRRVLESPEAELGERAVADSLAELWGCGVGEQVAVILAGTAQPSRLKQFALTVERLMSSSPSSSSSSANASEHLIPGVGGAVVPADQLDGGAAAE